MHIFKRNVNDYGFEICSRCQISAKFNLTLRLKSRNCEETPVKFLIINKLYDGKQARRAKRSKFVKKILEDPTFTKTPNNKLFIWNGILIDS